MFREIRRGFRWSWAGLALGLLIAGPACALDSHEVKNAEGETVFILNFLDITDPLGSYPYIAEQSASGFSSFGPAMTDEQKQAILRAADYWVERLMPTGRPVEPVTLHVNAAASQEDNAGAMSYNYQIDDITDVPSVWTVLVQNQRVRLADDADYHGGMEANTTKIHPDGSKSPNPLFTTTLSGQLPLNTWNLESTFIHELGHALGINGNLSSKERASDAGYVYISPFGDLLSGQRLTYRLDPADPDNCLDHPFVFMGEQAMAVYGAPVPMSGETGIDEADSHFGIFNHNMTHRGFRNYTVFTEVELAALNDLGYNIDLRNFFGRSIFLNPEGTVHDAQTPRVIVNHDGFFARNAEGTAYLPGVYNASGYGLGLHLFGDYIDLTQKADLLSNGFGGGGIRTDGVGNRVTIDSGVRVHALGELGIGLLVAHGHDTRIIHRGDLEATGPSGIGMYLGMGPGMMTPRYDKQYHSYFDVRIGMPDATPEFLARLTAYAYDEFGEPDEDDPDYTTKHSDFIWVQNYYSAKEFDAARAALDGALVKSVDIGGRVAGDETAIYIDPFSHTERINFLQGAEIFGDIVSDYTGTYAEQGLENRRKKDSGIAVKDMRTTLTFGLATAADGSALDGTSNADFRFLFQNDIDADNSRGYGFDALFAGGRTEFSGSRLRFNDVTTGIRLSSGAASSATLVLTGSTRLSADTYLQNMSSELILRASPAWELPLLEGREIVFEGSSDAAVSVELFTGMVGVEATLISASETLDGLTLDRVDLLNQSYALAYDLALSAQALTLGIMQRPDAFLAAGALEGAENELTGLGRALDQLAFGHHPALDPVFTALNRFPDAAGVYGLMRELANDDLTGAARDLRQASYRLYGGALHGALSRYRQGDEAFAWSSNIADADAALPSAEALGLAFANLMPSDPEECHHESLWTERPVWTVFGQGFGGFGSARTDRLDRDYDYYSVGFLLGSARRLGDDWYVGVAAGYTHARADLDLRGEIKDDVLRFGPVVGFARNGWFAEFSPTMGVHWLDGKRRVTGMGEAESDRTGYDLGTQLSAGHTFAWDNGFRLTPSAQLDYVWSVDPAYTERGNGAIALKSDRWTASNLTQTLMLKAGWAFAACDRRLLMTPEIWAGWEHEYLDGDASARVAFVSAPGASWKGNTGAVSGDRALLGAGMKAAVNECLSWQLRVEQRVWQHGWESNFSLGMRLDF